MIQKLEVKRLNNRDDGDHNLSFHHDLNIFTGENGSGKTTLLKLIWYLISGNLERVLVEIPFRSVSIWADPFSLSITRLNSDKVQFVSRENVFSKSVDFTITVNSETGKLEKHEDAEKLNELNFDIADAMKNSLFFPTFRRIEGGFSTSPMPDRYVTPNLQFAESAYSYRTPKMLQEAISELADVVSVNEHKFIASISTDDVSELLKQKRTNISKNIDEFQAELLQEITQKTEKYFSSERKSGTKESEQARSVLDNIQKRVDQVTTKRKTLLKPFSVLSDLTRSILRYQSIHITEQVAHGDGTEGITLDDGTEGITLSEAKKAISSDKLSSGEKQMLSFLCYNAFSNESPIFIDEPELSLHVDWQRLLLSILLEQKTSNQFFIATHSPFIYTMYPDKEFMLGDTRGYQGEV